jgi:hypothetical protein
LTEGLFTVCLKPESGKEALKDARMAMELYEYRVRSIVEFLCNRLSVSDLGMYVVILKDQNAIGAQDEEDKYPVGNTPHSKRMIS